METRKLLFEENEDTRLDVFLKQYFKDKSRSHIQKLIEEKLVTVNGKIKKSNYKLKFNDEVSVILKEPVSLNIEPEEIPLDVLYEDRDVIVVNKPQGMVVHPAAGIKTGTLVNALLSYCSDLSGINGVTRPGIVHRIDKDTSGILVVAKNDNSHNKLAEQLKDHSMTREYIALVEGVLKEEKGTIDKPIARHPKDKIKMAVVLNGKRAVTHYSVIERFKNNTLVKCVLETGRTHQIRVHMAYIGHPLVGDPVYGYKKQRFKLEGQLLHARKLGFIHPSTGKYIEFETEIPEYFKRIINILKKENN
ncbi:23S rRNA pseudouridine1911/1915/1917 synthase [Clostridium algifaecis]|uniref:Pseudouridine synthase n=1 Tax=Clostridium algifaecis TaxID=1472040 RepID=A0ABS4KN34_9CLOT|nr:RluA family pseudouridine synthase [Clostridium algifaecis]MBP2031448.1 23S rRNA pseudouridine1911/1915/1917 synthase [Clostridium algifaecis]